MKRKMIFFISFLFLTGICFFPVYAVSGEEEQVRIQVDFGIYHAVKPGRYVPVHITLEKVRDFTEGILEIRAPVSSREQYIYEHDILLKQKGTQNIDFYIPVYSETKYLQISVFDQEGNQVASRKETMILQNDYGEIFIGILDRMENDESRLNNLIIDDNSDISIKEFHITTDDFPEHIMDLNLLDVVIVNPSAEIILTQNKKKILEQWVDQGGLCVYNESGKNGYETFGTGGFYYFGDNLFYKDEESLRDIFLDIINRERLNEIGNDMMMTDYDYWQINDLVRISDYETTSFLYLYVGLLFLYLISVCPFVFLFLRKKRKSVFYSYCAVGGACLFSLLIFITGGKTRVYYPIVNYCEIINFSKDQTSEDIYLGIRSPDNGENEIRTDISYTILPVQNGYSNYYFPGDENFQERSDNYNLKMKIQNDCNIIKIKNKKAFDISLFRLKRTIPNTEKKSLDAKLHIFDNLITGTVVNNTGKELNDVFIAGFSQFYYIGSLKAGETRELYKEPLTNYSAQYFQTVGSVFDQKHSNAAAYYLSSCFSDPVIRFKAAGFMEEEEDFLEGSRDSLYVSGTTLVSQNCDVDFTEGEQTYYPVLSERPAVISGNYRYKIFMMESESCVVNYSLGHDLLVDYVTFHENNCESAEDISYRKKFSGVAYFMNWETGRYEETGVPGVFSADMLKPYLNKSNQIQVKYVDDSYGDSIYSIGIPYVTVTGRE